MRKITTKHGHEWMLPETVGEFQVAGVNLDKLCAWAGIYVTSNMCARSLNASNGKTPFNPNISGIGEWARSPDKKARTIAKKLTPELRAALLAELTKEPTNG